ncbi:hypothetical protein [Methylobacterium sp. ID0610]|uniref:hypothetical protein n=1 Tax=Methylobacterium carpenticola TaxID=3344827 RepID=UPI003687C64C
MTSIEIEALTKAREQLAKNRLALARTIAASADLDLGTIDALTTVIAAIESIDRVLLDSGHPYMPGSLFQETVR